jgi:oligopeptide transport system substrate-binding protein
VVDRYSYRIRINGELSAVRQYWLAMPFFSPMPWEAEACTSQPGMKQNNITLDWYPVGTGAYMLTENNPNMRMVLARNPNFHGEPIRARACPRTARPGCWPTPASRLPFVERAVYSLDKESIPYWNKFLQGFYDSSGISSDAFDQAISSTPPGEAGLTDDMREKGIELVTAVDTSIWYMGFNMVDPSCSVATPSGRGCCARPSASPSTSASTSPSSPTAAGSRPRGRSRPASSAIATGGGRQPYVFDWETAARVRKGSIRPSNCWPRPAIRDGRDPTTGRPLSIYYEAMDAGPDGKARLNWMRKQFAKLGIELVVRATDYNRFQEKMREGTGQVFMWGWNADYPDPENFFFLLYGPNKQDRWRRERGQLSKSGVRRAVRADEEHGRRPRAPGRSSTA